MKAASTGHAFNSDNGRDAWYAVTLATSSGGVDLVEESRHMQLGACLSREAYKGHSVLNEWPRTCCLGTECC